MEREWRIREQFTQEHCVNDEWDLKQAREKDELRWRTKHEEERRLPSRLSSIVVMEEASDSSPYIFILEFGLFDVDFCWENVEWFKLGFKTQTHELNLIGLGLCGCYFGNIYECYLVEFNCVTVLFIRLGSLLNDTSVTSTDAHNNPKHRRCVLYKGYFTGLTSRVL